MSKLTIISPSKEMTDSLQWNGLDEYLLSECNVRAVEYSNEMTDWIKLECVPDNRALGRRLGKKARAVKAALVELDQNALTQFRESGSVEVSGETVSIDEVAINYGFAGSPEEFENAQDGNLVVALTKGITDDLRRSGMSREVVSLANQLRKTCNLISSDNVWVYYEILKSGPELMQVIEENTNDIQTRLRSPFLPRTRKPAYAGTIGENSKEVSDGELMVYLVRPSAFLSPSGLDKAGVHAEQLSRYLQNKDIRN